MAIINAIRCTSTDRHNHLVLAVNRSAIHRSVIHIYANIDNLYEREYADATSVDFDAVDSISGFAAIRGL